MRRIALVLLFLVVFFSANAYALETKILEVRDKIFQEARSIQPLLSKSKDIILMSSMYESCVLAKTQIDAYFFMVGIFNVVKEKEPIKLASDYLVKWLNVIKKTNDVNIQSLNSMKMPIEPTTEMHVKKLKGYFAELNLRITQELKSISDIKNALDVQVKAGAPSPAVEAPLEIKQVKPKKDKAK
jgi:hypothetical protein